MSSLEHETKRAIRVTVVVPVYNNVRFLRAALDSLDTAGEVPLEAIIIDDGSSDGSGTVIDEFVATHPYAQAIHQQNAGVSAARNAALDIARGDYLAFLDGDDRFRENALSDMLFIADRYDADMVIGESRSVRTMGTTPLPQSKTLSMMTKIKPDDPNIIYSFSSCNKLFKREVVEKNGIRFRQIKHAEDGLFVYEFLRHAKTITGCPRYVYEYHKRLSIVAKSALKNLDLSMFESGMKACDAILELTSDWSEEFRHEMHKRILRVTLMNEYYRRLWVLDDETLAAVIERVNHYRALVGEDEWEQINAITEDIEAIGGLKTKREILANPLVSVVVFPYMEDREYRDFLSTLYFQSCPNFEVIVDERYAAATPDEYANKENLRFCRTDDLHDVVNSQVKGRYVQLVYEGCVYNENTIQLMTRRIKATETGFVSIRPLSYLDGKTVPYRPANRAFLQKALTDYRSSAKRKRRFELFDHLLSNKLFEVGALRGIVGEQTTAGVSFVMDAYKSLEYERFANVVIGITSNSGMMAKKEFEVQEQRKNEKEAQKGTTTSELNEKKLEAYLACCKSEPVDPKRVLFLSDIRAEMGGNYLPLYKPLLERGYEVILDFKESKDTARSEEEDLATMRNLATAKYILLEDFHVDTANIELREGQELCQLWHAAGAYKKFAWSRAAGSENINIHPGYKKYTKAIVSAEAIRHNYAEAFHIDISKVDACGIPRTDVFFEKGRAEAVKNRMYEAYPQIRGKKVVLIAPTYRGLTLKKATYGFEGVNPERLREILGDSYFFIYKWHPAVQTRISQGELLPFGDSVPGEYWLDLSAERDINDLMMFADILVTDYSSVVFEYALTKKPIVYYWPDVNEYILGRGTYYDMNEYVYGEVAYDIEELATALARAKVDEAKLATFMDKFMSACDGHSTEKTITFIVGE